MNINSILVICPRGGAGESFAALMTKELSMFKGEGRVGFSYPYFPEYKSGDPSLLQHAGAVVRDGMLAGVSEFLFTDTGITPILAEISSILPTNEEPIIYNPIDEARTFYSDPQERPLWLDRWSIMEKMQGFETLFSQDRQDLKDLIEEVVYRTRGVTGGDTENAPNEYKADLQDEDFLRTRAAQLLFKLSEKPNKNGILLGNIDLAMALTRYIDEEFRGYIEQCKFVHLAQVLAMRLF